jgi:hypothetical protein
LAEVEVFGWILVEFIELDVDIAVVVVELFGKCRGDRDVIAHLIESPDFFLIDFDFLSFGMWEIFEFADMLEIFDFLLFVGLLLGEERGFFNLFGELIVLDEIPEVGVDHFEEFAVGLWDFGHFGALAELVKVNRVLIWGVEVIKNLRVNISEVQVINPRGEVIIVQFFLSGHVDDLLVLLLFVLPSRLAVVVGLVLLEFAQQLVVFCE